MPTKTFKMPFVQLRKDLHIKETEEEAFIISSSRIGNTLGDFRSTNYKLNEKFPSVRSFGTWFAFLALLNTTFCGTHRG